MNHNNPTPLFLRISFNIVIIRFIAKAHKERNIHIGYTHQYLTSALSGTNAVTCSAQLYVFHTKLSHNTKNTHNTISALTNQKNKISIHIFFVSFLLNCDRKIRIRINAARRIPTSEKLYQ